MKREGIRPKAWFARLIAPLLGLTFAACAAEEATVEDDEADLAQLSEALLSGQALLVVGNPTLSTSDAALRGHLESLGYATVVVDDDVTTSTDAQNKRVVVVSESSYSGAVGTKFRDVAVPVLTMEPVGWGNMKMAPTDQHWEDTVGDVEDQRYLDVPSTHRLAPVTDGTLLLTGAPRKYVWATPSSSDAQIAATISGEPEKAAVFGYVAGAAMEGGFKAPHRRVAFFAGRDAAEAFTANAWAIFDGALSWITFQTSSNTALLVVAGVPLSASDTLAMNRLEGLGLAVKLVTDATVTTADANGKRLVAVSESVASANVAAKFKDVQVPVVSWEPAIWDDMNMAGNSDPWDTNIGDESGQTQLVLSTGNPLSAGLSGSIQITSAGDNYFWAHANGPSAIIGATISGSPTKAAVFGYDIGGTMMSSFKAPHRRVGLFPSGTALGQLKGPGWWLFDAAVTWAIAPQALLVIDDGSDAAPPDDAALAARLGALGYNVRTKDGAAATTQDAASVNLIVISESAKSSEVGTKFKTVTVPVINMEVALQDEFGMTSTSGQGLATGQSQVQITDSAHALAAGLSGTVSVTSSNRDMGWGTPGSGASVVAKIPGQSTQAAIYAYATGAQMSGLTAPAARVFLYPTRQSPTVSTDAGWALFEASVRWATGTSKPARTLSFKEQPSHAVEVSLAVDAYAVQVDYSVNGGTGSTLQLTHSGNTFSATLAGGAAFNVGDIIRASVKVSSRTLGPQAFTQNYMVTGSHIVLSVVGRDTPVLPYNSAQPIVIGPDESSNYAYASFTSPITRAEKAAMEAQGCLFESVVTTTNDMQVFRVIDLFGINVVASALQGMNSKFHNLTPLRNAEKFERATRPIVQGNTRRVLVTCGPQVNVGSCSSAVASMLTGIDRSYRRTFVGWATEAQIQALSAHASVIAGQELGSYAPAMKEARVASRVEYLQDYQPGDFPIPPTDSYSGSGILIGIYDSGVDPGHLAFWDWTGLAGLRQEPGATWANPKNVLEFNPMLDPAYDDHGTHVAGIAAGNGAHNIVDGSYSQHGVAVNATLYSHEGGHYGPLEHGNVVNHSTVESGEGVYSDLDQLHDQVLHEPWMYEDGIYKTIVLAAGNNGTENLQQSNQTAYYSVLNEAKNAIVVGNYDDATQVIAESSSMGPTRDGRLKPDLVAPGSEITATGFMDSTWVYPGEATPYYVTHSGTSMASPHVAGIAALMHQARRDQTPGCMANHDLCPAYDSEAIRNASIKAMMIQSAQDLVLSRTQAASLKLTPNRDLDQGEGQTSYSFYGAGPDYVTGWGLVDAFWARSNAYWGRYREEYDLKQDEVRRYKLQISWAGPQRVTIAWDDAAAATLTPQSTSTAEQAKRLVNDIDMYLIDPSGTAHFPWRPQPLLASALPVANGGVDAITLQAVENSQALRSSGAPSDSSTLFDHVNNVERVDVDFGTTGEWTVVVIGRKIDGSQNFSIAHDGNVGSDLELDEPVRLSYRARTSSSGSISAVWREWRDDDEVAGDDVDDSLLTAFQFETRGLAAGGLIIEGRRKFINAGLESDWSTWYSEGEQMLGQADHPFYPFTQMEFHVVFPHIGSLYYDIEYQAYSEGTGWGSWMCGGATAGTANVPTKAVRMRVKSSSTFPVCP